jgi:Fe-S cluster biosynthesis and repair protein YggX
MTERIVHCVKYKQDLPGLEKPPVPGELGEKIFAHVSQKAWDEFMEYFKMIINEYRLDLTNPLTDNLFEQKVDDYLFQDLSQMPEDYVPIKS